MILYYDQTKQAWVDWVSGLAAVASLSGCAHRASELEGRVTEVENRISELEADLGIITTTPGEQCTWISYDDDQWVCELKDEQR